MHVCMARGQKKILDPLKSQRIVAWHVGADSGPLEEEQVFVNADLSLLHP